MTGPLATDEVDDASDELLNEDQNDADLELSEDYDRTTFLDDGVGDLAKANSTQGPPESTNRFFKKKWKSWKKKAKKSWKRARKPWKKGYRGVRKSWRRGYRGARKSWKRGYRGVRKSWKRGYRGVRKSRKRTFRGARRTLKRISWRKVSNALGRMRRAARPGGLANG